MTISKAMHEYPDLPRSLIDYVRGAYKHALEKKESTLPFALLKIAVGRGQTALKRVVPPSTVHVRLQQDLARSSKTVDEGESRANEGQGGRKVTKSKGKAKAGPEDFRDNNVGTQTAEKTGRIEEAKGGMQEAKKWLRSEGRPVEADPVVDKRAPTSPVRQKTTRRCQREQRAPLIRYPLFFS